MISGLLGNTKNVPLTLTVGFICEYLADADEDTAFDESFSIIARTFGKSALSYAKERGFLL